MIPITFIKLLLSLKRYLKNVLKLLILFIQHLLHTSIVLLLYANSILCSPIFSVCLQSGRRLTFQQPTTISHKFHKIVHFDVQNIWIVSVFHPVVCTAVDVIFFDMLSTVSVSNVRYRYSAFVWLKGAFLGTIVNEDNVYLQIQMYVHSNVIHANGLL